MDEGKRAERQLKIIFSFIGVILILAVSSLVLFYEPPEEVKPNFFECVEILEVEHTTWMSWNPATKSYTYHHDYDARVTSEVEGKMWIDVNSKAEEGNMMTLAWNNKTYMGYDYGCHESIEIADTPWSLLFIPSLIVFGIIRKWKK